MQTKKTTKEDIIKCLQIAFYMVVSKKVRSLTPIACELYKVKNGFKFNNLKIKIM